eukprot:UC4_evm4s704
MLEEEWEPVTIEKTGNKQFLDKKTKQLMMLPTDLALRDDKEFRKYVDLYAADIERFHADFSKAFTKLQENGCQTLGQPVTWNLNKFNKNTVVLEKE